MRRPWFFSLLVLIIIIAAAPCSADSISITGSLNPDDANDVLLISFTLAGTTNVTIQSYGYGGTSGAPGGTNAAGNAIPSGGFDTYFSLFSGIGPGATFLMSNDDGTCPPSALAPACRDSQFILTSFAAGGYTLALSVFDNFSFAENLGTGTLGDGFIGLGSYFNSDSQSFRNPNYAIDFTANGLTINSVSETSPAVPEPTTAVLLATVLAIVCIKLRATAVRTNRRDHDLVHPS